MPDSTRSLDNNVMALTSCGGLGSRIRTLVLLLAAMIPLCGIAALGAAFWLVGGSGRWDLLPSMVLSRGQLRPAPLPPLSNSAALDIRPIPEVRLTAPAGALGRDRKFSVARYSGERLAELDRWARISGIQQKASFYIDAEMSPKELFPGELTVRVDLAKIGLPREQWPRFAAVHINSPNEPPERLAVELDGSEAVLRLRHNGPLLTGVVTTIIGVALTKYLLGRKQEDFDTWMQDEDERFVYHWLPSEPGADPPTAKLYEDRLRSIAVVMDNLELHSSQDQEQYDKLQLRLIELNSSLEKDFPLVVRRNKVWPKSVQQWADNLGEAYTYLIGVRKFRSPWRKTDIYLRNPWPHDSASAVTQKFAFNSPFIDIRDEPSRDERQVDAVHELFHVIQKGYRTTADWTSYGWFDEASAPVLERDARNYFVSRNLAASWRFTERTWVAFQRALDWPPSGDKQIVDHGYSASHFLEWLQDKYYKANRDQFLKTLYEHSSTLSGGRTDSLIAATSGDQTKFEDDYREFVLSHSSDILSHGLLPADRRAVLNSANPKTEWLRRQPGPPYSALSYWVLIGGLSSAQQAGTKVVIQQVEMHPDVRMYSSPDATTQTEVKGAEWVASPGFVGGRGQLDLQRIEPGFRREVATPSGGIPYTKIFALIPPANAPTCTVSNKELRITWPESRLAELRLVTDYRIKVRPPSGPMLTIKTKENDTTIDLSELRALVMAQDTSALKVFHQQVSQIGKAMTAQAGNQDLLDIWDIREFGEYLKWKKSQSQQSPWRISYLETAGRTFLIEGGESPPCTPNITPSDLDPGEFDPTGEWIGRILFTNQMIDMTLRSNGSGLTGTAAYRGERQREIAGIWDPALEGWRIQSAARGPNVITVEQLPEPLRSLARFPVVRFSHRRLWMQFPPAIFYQPASGPGPRNMPVPPGRPRPKE